MPTHYHPLSRIESAEKPYAIRLFWVSARDNAWPSGVAHFNSPYPTGYAGYDIEHRDKGENMRVLISDTFAKQHKTTKAREDIFDTQVSGLRLRISKTGVKSWDYR